MVLSVGPAMTVAQAKISRCILGFFVVGFFLRGRTRLSRSEKRFPARHSTTRRQEFTGSTNSGEECTALEFKILDYGDIELESSFLVISGGDSAMADESQRQKAGWVMFSTPQAARSRWRLSSRKTTRMQPNTIWRPASLICIVVNRLVKTVIRMAAAATPT
jgi:hypothetical protein